MPNVIYDWNGTTSTANKGIYDWNGSASTQLKKAYDYNGTTNTLVYELITDEYLFNGNGAVSSHPITYFTGWESYNYPRDNSQYVGAENKYSPYGSTGDTAIQFKINSIGEWKYLNFLIAAAGSSSGWYTRIGINTSNSGTSWYGCGPSGTQKANIQLTNGGTISNVIKSIDISSYSAGTYYAWLRIEEQGSENYASLKCSKIWLSKS